MRRTITNKNSFTYIKAIYKNSFSLSKSLRLSIAEITPCPIKPTENIIPKDLNLQKIFTNMIRSSQELSKTYSALVIKYSFSSITLNINLNNTKRKTILKKIRDFFLYYNIDYKIYYKTILLYDIISLENESKKILSSIEEIALGALILSIKFNYDENKMFSMKKFLKFFITKNYTLSEIIDIERKAIKIINYYLNFASPMCFLEFFLLNGIIYNIDNVNKEDYAKIYFQLENILGLIMEESYNYLKYSFFYLACAVVSYCREMFNLEKWPKMLKKVFSVDFYFFQTEYNYYFVEKEINKDNYNNKIYSHKKYNYNNRKDIIINGSNNLVLLDLKNLYNNSGNKNDNNNEKKDDNNNDNSKIRKQNYIFNSYKKNYYKEIDPYNNNIINISINNVSFNNIYNDSTNTDSENKNNNSKEKQNIRTSIKYNRFHYNIDNNSIFYNNEVLNDNGSLLQNNIIAENNNKNNEKDEKHQNILNLKSNLTEIKETKDLESNNFSSPPKIKRRHYNIFKKEDKFNQKIEEKIQNEENEEKY